MTKDTSIKIKIDTYGDWSIKDPRFPNSGECYQKCALNNWAKCSLVYCPSIKIWKSDFAGKIEYRIKSTCPLNIDLHIKEKDFISEVQI